MKSQNRRPSPPTASYPLVVALLTVCFLLSGLTGYAQLSSAAVNGTIRDATGAVIAGAKVTLLQISTATARNTESNSVGSYAFIDVAPGDYTLKVAKAGFATARQNSIVLYVNQTAT